MLKHNILLHERFKLSLLTTNKFKRLMVSSRTDYL